MFDFKGKYVLVAGGSGLIGTQLVNLLIQEGAHVRVASLDSKLNAHPHAVFWQIDLMDSRNCQMVCQGMDYVFNLLCVKGSPETAANYPATLYDANLLLDHLMLRASRLARVKGYLLASSLAVYPPQEIMSEESLWKGYPSSRDWYAGWAKRMGEVQVDAYRKQYGDEMTISVVRPANVYGPFDDFESEGATVVASLIRKIVNGMNPLEVWGDGSQERDFIHSLDAARGMLFVAKSGIQEPVNLCTGHPVIIRELVNIIIDCVPNKPDVYWDASKPSGDKRRILDDKKIKSLGFRCLTSLEAGISETVKWYQQNRGKNTRYDPFK